MKKGICRHLKRICIDEDNRSQAEEEALDTIAVLVRFLEEL